MAPRWASYRRPLVFMLFAACVIVTLAFDANVEAQGGAYATGVLVLILSAALAVALGLWKERARLLSAVFWLIGIVFAFTLVDNVIERPDGLIIATVFIIAILAISAISRFARSTELGVLGLDFADPRSQELWQSLRGKKIHLVPIRDPASRKRKMAKIRRYHNVPGPLAFIHVNLLNNRSEFLAPLRVQVSREGDHYAIEVSGAIAIANTIAYISELLDPISIFLGLTRQNLMRQALRYVFWGEGETGLMVYTILVRYWEWTPEEDVRPLIFLLSD
jgi:hypothetical protein